jgi:hypothetical protein
LPDNARSKTYDTTGTDAFITNPPFWGRSADLHPLIENLSDQVPTWLLMSGDWLFNRSSAPMMSRLHKIVTVGRARWIPGSPHSGKDNCAWMRFTRPSDQPTILSAGSR